MSSGNLWQICHKNKQGNKVLTVKIVRVIRVRSLTSKQVADDITVPTERVRNWFYRKTGMTALDLLLLMCEYDFIRKFVNDMIIEYHQAEASKQKGALHHDSE